MIAKVTTHGMAEQYLVVFKTCHKYPQKYSAYDSAYGITAQECRSAYGSAYTTIIYIL